VMGLTAQASARFKHCAECNCGTGPTPRFGVKHPVAKNGT